VECSEKPAPIKTAMIDFKRHLSSLSKSDSSNTYATVRLKRRHHQPWGGSRRYAISSIHILSEKHLGHNIACMDTGGGLRSVLRWAIRLLVGKLYRGDFPRAAILINISETFGLRSANSGRRR
jgi:hypothetical protein